MKISILVAVMLLTVIFVNMPGKTIAYERPLTVQETIILFAQKYGVSENMMLAVANCESGFKQSAVGDGTLAKGIYQFHQSTWDRISKMEGEKLDINSIYDQAKLASFAFKNNLQSNWTCYYKTLKA